MVNQMFQIVFNFVFQFINFIIVVGNCFLEKNPCLNFNLKHVTVNSTVNQVNSVRFKVMKGYSFNMLSNLASKAEAHGGATYPTPIQLNYS